MLVARFKQTTVLDQEVQPAHQALQPVLACGSATVPDPVVSAGYFAGSCDRIQSPAA